MAARPRVSRSASVPSSPATREGMLLRPSGFSTASRPSPRADETAFSEKNAERRAAEKEVAQLRQQYNDKTKNYTVELMCVCHGLIALVVFLLSDVAARFVFTFLCSSVLFVRFLATVWLLILTSRLRKYANTYARKVTENSRLDQDGRSRREEERIEGRP
jgi:hypothetical protein